MAARIEETHDARRAAVLRIVAAAKKIAADRTIIAPLVEATGLSREGVELALRDHLETHPSAAEVDRLVAGASRSSHVHVILSANVFVGALRAIACARAVAPKVSVRASSREPVFASALLRAIDDPAIFEANDDTLDELREGEAHVYGRAETIARVKKRVAAGVVVRGHGPGIGVAHVAKADSVSEAASAIARDVVPFDQRGCLSPRVVFVVGDFSRAEEFARSLAAALALLGEEIPRGDLTKDELGESTRYLETMRYAGSNVDVGRHFAVAVSRELFVPPAGRHVHITCIESDDALSESTHPIASFLTSVGTNDATIRRFFSRFVRVAALGQMQKPPFDGPVDLRVL